MQPIYLDYNATTPVDPRVVEAMLPYLRTHFGNPSSSHFFGRQARIAVEQARQQVAHLIGCSSEEIIFTSGGTESNNLAIKGVAEARRDRGNHIITSAIEHPAVLEVCNDLEKRGFRITRVAVDRFGSVDVRDIEKAITLQTILITVMHANNEVGTLQPIAEIAALAHQQKILLHSDAAQSVGKIPVRIDELGVDLLSIAGHKFYAPKGVGALFVRSGVRVAKIQHGADHEQNRRAGTENVPEIVGLGAACALAAEALDETQTRLAKLRDRLEEAIGRELPDRVINGHPQLRLPNTASIAFPGLDAATLLAEITEIAASAGAACHSDGIDLSPVLQAMGLPQEIAMGTLRFSVGRMTTEQEIDRAAERIIGAVKRLRPQSASAPIAESVDTFKLTRYTHGLGCACKLRPQLLEEVLRDLPLSGDPAVLVGTDTGDDAAVYRLSASHAVVQTVDFFTPIVDDPYSFGAISAANSLSDIYAMGGRPLFALNIVAFPGNRLPISVLHDILRGARDKAQEAGIAIIGGHTVDDNEPKFGLAVTGLVDPQRIWRNQGAQPGDHLILTKAIGTGILTTALKQEQLDSGTAELLIRRMAELNRTAAETLARYSVHACTDITGFGLIGHVLEMVAGSRIGAVLISDHVPLLPRAADLAAGGTIPGGTRDNFAFTQSRTDYADALSDLRRLLLNDAQTSGGLCAAVPENQSVALLADLHRQGISQAAVIGSIVDAHPGRVRVEKETSNYKKEAIDPFDPSQGNSKKI